jgi:hypothetical protein
MRTFRVSATLVGTALLLLGGGFASPASAGGLTPAPPDEEYPWFAGYQLPFGSPANRHTFRETFTVPTCTAERQGYNDIGLGIFIMSGGATRGIGVEMRCTSTGQYIVGADWGYGGPGFDEKVKEGDVIRVRVVGHRWEPRMVFKNLTRAWVRRVDGGSGYPADEIWFGVTKWNGVPPVEWIEMTTVRRDGRALPADKVTRTYMIDDDEEHIVEPTDLVRSGQGSAYSLHTLVGAIGPVDDQVPSAADEPAGRPRQPVRAAEESPGSTRQGGG